MDPLSPSSGSTYSSFDLLGRPTSSNTPPLSNSSTPNAILLERESKPATYIPQAVPQHRQCPITKGDEG
ncbi:hypothetical protein SK128_019485, partial [Halocaridina rubra]